MTLTPTRASCFNNRAQIHRFNSDISAALQDLNEAIQISNGRGRSACQAFCQRGTYVHCTFISESNPKKIKPFSSDRPCRYLPSPNVNFKAKQEARRPRGAGPTAKKLQDLEVCLAHFYASDSKQSYIIHSFSSLKF